MRGAGRYGTEDSDVRNQEGYGDSRRNRRSHPTRKTPAFSLFIDVSLALSLALMAVASLSLSLCTKQMHAQQIHSTFSCVARSRDYLEGLVFARLRCDTTVKNAGLGQQHSGHLLGLLLQKRCCARRRGSLRGCLCEKKSVHFYFRSLQLSFIFFLI